MPWAPGFYLTWQVWMEGVLSHEFPALMGVPVNEVCEARRGKPFMREIIGSSQGKSRTLVSKNFEMRD